MKTILITYSTTDGQTKLICEKIKSILEKTFMVELQSIRSIKKNSELLNKNFSYVIIGASIRYGKHSSDVYEFIENNINIKKKLFISTFSVFLQHI